MINGERHLNAIAIKDNVYKILSTMALCFLAIAAVLLWNKPLVHYELSPYSDVTLFVWIFLIISFGITSYILISSQEGNQSAGLGIWGIVALGILILDCAVVVLFPYIRSVWFMGRGDDTLAHIGFLQSKLLTGHHSSPYPPLTDITAALTMICDISPFTSNSSISPFFIVMNILFIYCLAKVVFNDKKIIALSVVLAAVTLLNEPTAKPYYLSPTLLPLALMFYFSRSNNINYTIGCVVYLLLIVFFHPLTALLLILCLLCIEIFNHLKKDFASVPIKNQAKGLVSLNTLLFFGVSYLGWMIYVNFIYMVPSIVRLKKFFSTDVAVGPVNEYLFHFPEWGITGSDILILFFKIYGKHIFFVILTLMALILIYRKICSRTAGDCERKLFTLSCWPITMGLLFVIFLGFIEAFEISVFRLINFTLVPAPLFAAYALYRLLNFLNDRAGGCLKISDGVIKNNLSIGLILLIICIPFTLMIFSIYSSPYICVQNQQVMKGEITGTDWVLSRTNVDSKIGTLEERLQETAPLSWRDHYHTRTFRRLPDHFGYDQVSSISYYPNMPDYIVFTNARIIRTIEMHIPKDWITEADLGKFYNDTSINLIYSNHEYFAFLVSP